MSASSLMRRALMHQREMASPRIPDAAAPACRAHQATKRSPRLLCYSAQNEKTKIAKMNDEIEMTRCLARVSLNQAFLTTRSLNPAWAD